MIKFMVNGYPMDRIANTGEHTMVHNGVVGLMLDSTDPAVYINTGVQQVIAQVYVDDGMHISIPIPEDIRGEGLSKAQRRTEYINAALRSLDNSTGGGLRMGGEDLGFPRCGSQRLEFIFPIAGRRPCLRCATTIDGMLALTSHDEVVVNLRVMRDHRPAVSGHNCAVAAKRPRSLEASIASNRKATNAALRPFREGQARRKMMRAVGLDTDDVLGTAREEWAKIDGESLAVLSSDPALYVYGMLSDATVSSSRELAVAFANCLGQVQRVESTHSGLAFDILFKRGVISTEWDDLFLRRFYA